MVTIAPVVDLPTGHLRLTFSDEHADRGLAAERQIDVQAEPPQGWTRSATTKAAHACTPRVGPRRCLSWGVVAFGGSSWR
jgi:hypothetical protein